MSIARDRGGPQDRAVPESLTLYDHVYEAVSRVPEGRVVTYGQVARALGMERGARMVGYAMRATPTTSKVPWWRVINASGRISPRGVGDGAEVQREMLEAEGVRFGLTGAVDLGRFGWEFRA